MARNVLKGSVETSEFCGLIASGCNISIWHRKEYDVLRGPVLQV